MKISPIKFIEIQSNNLISLFPHLRIRHEYNILANCHYIEVSSSLGNFRTPDYINFENSLIQNFITSFSNECICFITEESLYEIESINLEKQGSLYGIDYSRIEESMDIEDFNGNYNNFNLVTNSFSQIPFIATSKKSITSDIFSIDYIQRPYADESSYALAA